MTASDKSTAAPKRRLKGQLLDRFDAFANFASLESALILRNIRIASGKGSDPFFGSIRTVVIIIAHIYFFWMISRSMPAGISQVEFVTPAFTMWFLLSGASRYRKPNSPRDTSSKQANIKWINILIADLTIESMQTIFAYIFIFVLFAFIYNDQRVMTMKYVPLIPKTVYLMFIAILMGLGLRLVSEYLVPRWKLFSLLLKVLMFLIYVTCGIYSSLASLPPLIAPYFAFNPLIHLTESARQAVHSGYPIWGVDTRYPLVLACILVFVGLGFRRLDRRAG
jgi:ABC-type polysaccharide/polyol phosphate export permease